MSDMAKRRTFSLADALILILLLLLPVMLLVGAAETGPKIGPGLLFWLLLLLPAFFLPWLLRPAVQKREAAAETRGQSEATASAAAQEFARAVAPVLNVSHAYVTAGVPHRGRHAANGPRTYFR